MSDATLNQGTEGVQNGIDSKNMAQEEFSSSYLHAASQPGYGMPPNDQYMPGYYGQMPYPSYMGEWSTAGESVPYLSSYNNMGNGEPHNFMQDAMFGQQPTGLNNGQHYFTPPVFRHGNEFTAWTSPAPHARGLDAGAGHPVAPNSYTGDFYQQMMPTMPQDYVGRSNVIGNSVGIGLHNGQPGMLSGGDVSNKLTASPNTVNVIEHGIATLNVHGMCGDAEPIVGKNKNQVNVSVVASHVDNGPMQTTYTSQIQPKLLPDSSAQQIPSVSKPISWAAIASKPAKPQPKPKVKPQVGLPPPIKHNMEVGSWDSKKLPQRGTLGSQYGSGANNWSASSGFTSEQVSEEFDHADANNEKQDEDTPKKPTVAAANPVLDKLKFQNEYNPKRLTMDLRNSRFFVIKSYSEDDIHRSIKYNIWCSTEHGNKRLDATYRAQKNRGPVLLLYSVNGSGHFCGVAEMKTCVDYSSRAGVWSQDKWKGKFQVKWIYVKDVPNTVLRHIRLENNDNKPVTNSRDTQEVPAEKGRQVLKIIANYKHQTSIFDDFGHYERRQQEEETQKNRAAQAAMVKRAGELPQTGSSKNNNFA